MSDVARSDKKNELPNVLGGQLKATKPRTSLKKQSKKSSRKLSAKHLDAGDFARLYLKQRWDGQGLRRHNGIWYAYAGGYYRELKNDELDSDLYLWTDELVEQITTFTHGNLRKAVEALTIVSSEFHQPCWLDPDEAKPSQNCIVVANGLLDIDAAVAGDPGALRPHSPLWFSTLRLPYNYDSFADCRIWKKVLADNLEGDVQRLALCQEFAGYCLAVNSTEYQRFGLLHGAAGTGKSAYLMGLTGTFGHENCSALSIEQIGERFAPQDLLGKLANISAETGEIDRVHEAQLRELVDGSLRLFDRKYKAPISTFNRAKLIFSCNDLPRFRDRSNALWRRMLLIPFNRVIREHEKRREYAEPGGWESLGECPGMLNWAIEGLRRLRRQNGFTKSDACESLLAQHKSDCNPAQQFLLDHFEEYAGAITYVDSLYVDYREWCELQRIDRPLAKHTFGVEVHRTFPKIKSDRQKGGKRRRFHAGLREITPQAELTGVPPQELLAAHDEQLQQRKDMLL